MKELLMLLGTIGLIWLIEYVWGRYLDSLPKDKRDELIKKQSQMCCSNCGSTDFEVIGMKRGQLQFQCKCCKKVR